MSGFRSRGFTLMEITIALTMLIVALSIGLSAWAHAAHLRRIQERRVAMRETLDLVLERVSIVDISQLPRTGEVRNVGLPKELIARLPDVRCSLSTDPTHGDIKLIRVRVNLISSESSENESGEILRVVEGAR